MHIPDGYLSPATCAVLYAAMAPVWYLSGRKMKSEMNEKRIPFAAMGAAFVFIIMMFNIPVPGGTTGHATGGVLASIILGPWAACMAVTVALAIQALLFGDGGITAFGANCFNMAFVCVFAGYWVFRAVAMGSAPDSKRRIWAAGAGGYIGLNLAALATGVEFGIQPLLYKTASGQALYCPYGFGTAIPAMLLSHMLLFGIVEAAITALVVKYLSKHDAALLEGGVS